MERKVTGAGLMFLGSGCGPALSDEQRNFLRQIKPDEFYPLTHLLEMFAAAATSENDLLYATGRRWGAALKEALLQSGATNGKDAIRITSKDMYPAHHQGDVGQLIAEEDGEAAMCVTNTGPYPMVLVAGMYQVIAAAFADGEAKFVISEEDRRVRISWRNGDEA